MTSPIPVKPHHFTPSTLPPDPRPFRDNIIVLVTGETRELYVSNGAAWVPVGSGGGTDTGIDGGGPTANYGGSTAINGGGPGATYG